MPVPELIAMVMNRIQFQPDLSLLQFMELYGTNEKCEVALEQAGWPDGFCFRLNRRFEIA